MCKKIGKIINKVTSFHDKIDPFGKKLRDPIEDALGVPRSGTIGTELFPDDEVATGSNVAVTTPGAPPTENSAESLEAREAEKRRRLAASGQNSTILTGPNGVRSAASTGAKTLLGA